MAIARVQKKFGGGDGAQATPVSTGNFPGSCTAGNLIVVTIRQSSVNTVSGVTDTLGTTYTLAKKDESRDPSLYVYSGVLIASGTNAVAAAASGAWTYVCVHAVEYGGWAGGSPTLNVARADLGSSVTDQVSGAFSTTDAIELVLVSVAMDNFVSYTAGTDFTLVDGAMPHNSNDFMGVEEYITSGALSGYTAHITGSTSTTNYTMITTSYRNIGAGGGSGKPAAASYYGMTPHD